jgi:CotS family spore coat protein
MKRTKIAAHVLRGFGVKAMRIRRAKKGVYRVVLRTGKTYSLKRMPVSPKVLRWMDRSLHSISANGFNRLAWRRRHTKAGRRLLVKAGGRSYILTPWISGRWAKPRSARDMRACGAALGHFHKAGGRNRRLKPGAVNRVGKWPSELRAKHLMISKLVLKSARKKHNLHGMDRLLRRHGREILRYSRQARRLLNIRGYRKACRNRRLIRLCHGDGGPSNFIRNAKGMHLIDFETLRVDLRAYDLYRVIYNSCKDHAWRFSIARQILDGYQSVTKLSKADYAMLSTLLRFPRTTSLLLNRYRLFNIRGRKRLAKPFTRALRAERRMAVFIRKLRRYARQ